MCKQQIHLIIALSLCIWPLSQSLHASTIMVAVQAVFSDSVVSPGSLDRAKMLARDIEDGVMKQMFGEGHIAFNVPAYIQTQGSPQQAPASDELIWQTRNGGGDTLILCTIGLTQILPDKPLRVTSCKLRMLPVQARAGLPMTWTVQLGESGLESELLNGVKKIFPQLPSKL